VDLVRSIFADWERGDFTSVDWAHPEIEFVRPDGPEPGSSTGLGGMAEAWRDWLSVWEEFGNHADAYRELDDERVLVLTRRSGRGKISGLEIGEMRTHGAQLFHVRNGMVTKYVFYFDRDRALADLGLGPEGDAPDSPS
jgi:ketosteroid isomerase-like protein